MIGNITFGQYYPVDSPVHRLDPRVKLTVAFALIIAVFFITEWVGFALYAAALCGVIGAARLPFGRTLKGIKPLWMIILITFVLNMFFFTGETILVRWGFIVITREGLLQAITVAVRLMLLIETTTVLMLTTSPMELTHAIERLLRPLAKIKVPVHEIAMMMSIAMRFVPTLIDETDKIMKAQTARGAEFDSGNLLKRAVSLVPLLVPLFVGAFARADELALAMESRCYHGGTGRTRLRELKACRADWLALLGSAVAIAAMVIPWLRLL